MQVSAFWELLSANAQQPRGRKSVAGMRNIVQADIKVSFMDPQDIYESRGDIGSLQEAAAADKVSQKMETVHD